MIIYLLRFWLPFMVNGRIFRELAEWYLLKCWHLETSHMFSLQVKLQPAVMSNYVAPQARFPLHLTDGCKYGSTMWRNLGQCFPTFFFVLQPHKLISKAQMRYNNTKPSICPFYNLLPFVMSCTRTALLLHLFENYSATFHYKAQDRPFN